MKRPDSGNWNNQDVQYTKSLFAEMKDIINERAFGEDTMFYPCSSSSEDEDEEMSSTVNPNMESIETALHKKLAKYDRMQPNFVGCLIAYVLYFTGMTIIYKTDKSVSLSLFSLLATLTVISMSFLALTLKSESARKSSMVGFAAFAVRLLMHLIFLANLYISHKVPVLIKVLLVRASVMTPSTIKVQLVSFSVLDILTDLGILLILAKEQKADLSQTAWYSLGLYVMATAYHLYYRQWSSAMLCKISSWLKIVLGKLVVHSNLYNALGGHPTIWQRNKTAGTRRRQCLPNLSLTKTLSSPGVRSSEKSLNRPFKSDERSHSFSGHLDSKEIIPSVSPKVRMSMTADEISSILKDVFYTPKTTFEAMVNGKDDLASRTKFEASCNSFRLLMAKHVEKEGLITMELVWEELINIILANYNCIIKLSNLEMSLGGSSGFKIACTLTACSFWSVFEHTRYFYSKLEKDGQSGEPDPPVSLKEKSDKEIAAIIDLSNLSALEDKKSTEVLSESKKDTSRKSETIMKDSPISSKSGTFSESKEPPFKPEELISVVVHDMRSPLMCILGNLELIDYELRDKPSYSLVEPLIKSSMSASALLETLVSDILDAARIAKGIFKINPVKMNLEETLKECVSTVNLAASSRHVEIHMDYETEHRIITSDKHRIKQVMLNFLSNSIKFTQNGNIWISVRELSNTMQVSIRDDGIGISPEMLPHIFSKYKSDNQNKKNSQGIGLGLFICKSIIQKIGPKKEIKVKSKVGEGTTFTFEIYKDAEKESSPRAAVSHEQSHLRKYAYGTMGCSNNKAKSTKEIALMNSYSKPRSNMTIFALNNQSAMESRRLIQTKMRWDISWITKFKETIPSTDSPEKETTTVTKMGSSRLSNKAHPFKRITSSETSNINNSRIDLSASQVNLHDTDYLKHSHPLIKASLDDVSMDEESVELDLSVLIVDDEPFILELLSDFFIIASEDLNIKVVEDSAPDIQTTASKMESKDYDLVIIDFYLPDGTGPGFVKTFIERKKQEGGKIPLFALSTGAEMHEISAETDPSIFFKILTKPITLAKFKDLLHAVKHKKRLESS